MEKRRSWKREEIVRKEGWREKEEVKKREWKRMEKGEQEWKRRGGMLKQRLKKQKSPIQKSTVARWKLENHHNNFNYYLVESQKITTAKSSTTGWKLENHHKYQLLFGWKLENHHNKNQPWPVESGKITIPINCDWVEIWKINHFILPQTSWKLRNQPIHFNATAGEIWQITQKRIS